jgi:hypothetical protein
VTPALTPEQQYIADRFVRWAGGELIESSPLYNYLAQQIGTDPLVLDLAAAATSRPLPHLLLGAVHYLLMDRPTDPLAAFYPDLAGEPAPGDPYPAFHAFCARYAAEIRQLVQMQRVQTNEVRRCAILLPAFGLVGAQTGDRPLTLVEIGTSAGLNLFWDRYRYDYGAAGQAGDPGAPVLLECDVRGDRVPPIPVRFPPVARRIGIDLYPVDVRDAGAVHWLRALIWPEHQDRRELFDQASAVVQAHPPDLRAGDALEVLPQVLAELPADVVPCLFHSYTLNQFTPEGRTRFAAILAATGAVRDLYCIAVEWLEGSQPTMTLQQWQAGQQTERLLARCHAHGRWIEWVAD